jgi:hypothetical protein
MSKKHVVSFDELKEHSFRQSICGSYGKKESKSLECVVKPPSQSVLYQVFDHGIAIYNGRDIVEAINAYNNA